LTVTELNSVAVTVVREDRPGDRRLVGYLIAEEGQTIDMAAVQKNLSERLPEYMVPSVVTTLSEFPLTPNGKLDRKSFPAPSQKRPEIGVEFVAPATDQEKQLTKIWGDVLSSVGVPSVLPEQYR